MQIELKKFWTVMIGAFLMGMPNVFADELVPISDVDLQPLKSQATRVIQALKFLGEPLTDAEQKAYTSAIQSEKPADAIGGIQKVLDSRVLAAVHINPESRVKVAAGPAKRELNQNGWRIFLVKVHNEGGVTANLSANSPNAAPLYKISTGSPRGSKEIKPSDVSDRWLDLRMFENQPLTKKLSGLEVEYKVIQLYSREAGKREAKFGFDVGQGTQDLGFRNELSVLFEVNPAVKVKLDIVDHDGKPTTGQFVIRDARGQVYPARSRRLAPDFFFHDQIYRTSGEHIFLPPGEFNVTFTRGPEYRIEKRKITVPNAQQHKEVFRLNRWIQLTDYRWFSGDHHIHAAGCAHYESPTEGVTPQDMMRHILGEDLNVGCVLTWGPCWYHQKTFFEGTTHQLSKDDYLMRYDVEVSGFPSSHAGHLCLLNLKEDDYVYPKPTEFDFRYGAEKGTFKGQKTSMIGQWPSYDLPVLKWGKSQGGIVGFSHSGWGLDVKSNQLPNYEMPPFNGIGANEYIIDVCHDVCDFISSVDTPSVWELNIWYHTLNCGYTCRISGETDFPCIYGDRVGLGRAYVKLDKGQELNFENWIQGIKDGRSYCGDGLSHLIDFSINDFEVGTKGDKDRVSFLAAKSGDMLKVQVKTSALLNERPNEAIRKRPLSQKPYWHVERARVGDSQKVPVELIVNGVPVAKKEIVADGSVLDLEFDYKIEKSSWVALRIYPTCHTNPIFVEVDGQPIRASKRSAKWCLDAVDVCFNAKKGQIRPHELKDFEAATEFARQAYKKILAESYDDTKK